MRIILIIVTLRRSGQPVAGKELRPAFHTADTCLANGLPVSSGFRLHELCRGACTVL